MPRHAAASRIGHGLHRHQRGLVRTARRPAAARRGLLPRRRGLDDGLIGANGAGKTTLLRIIRGDEPAHGGAVSIGGATRRHGPVRRPRRGGPDRARPAHHGVAGPRPHGCPRARGRGSRDHRAGTTSPTQLGYAGALAEYAEAGGYEYETVWDRARSPRSACRSPGPASASSRPSPAGSRSASLWRRCCADRMRCCCSTSPTTTSTSRGSAGSRRNCARRPRPCCSSRTIASCSHAPPTASSRSRRAAPAVRRGCTAAGSRPITRRRDDRMDRLDELRRRWDEQHAKLKALVAAMKVKATANDGFASRYRAAQTRLRQFEEAGPPQERPPRAGARRAAARRPHRQARGRRASVSS